MTTQWRGPHFIVVAAASAFAFAGGYMMAGRSRPAPSVPTPVANTSNGVAGPTGIPGFDTNGQAPQRRGRVDENQLVAENAEREDNAQPRRPPAGRDEEPRETERRRPPRDSVDEPPFEPPEEEDPGYGPEGG